MLTCQELFYAKSLGNRFHSTFIFIFLRSCFFRFFCTQSDQIRIIFNRYIEPQQVLSSVSNDSEG